MNEHQKVFYVNREKTTFFKFKSTEVHLLFHLVCLSDKNGRFGIRIGQIACQSSSCEGSDELNNDTIFTTLTLLSNWIESTDFEFNQLTTK